MLCLAIDIGGTKFAAGLVDDDGRVLARDQVATAGASDSEALWDRLAALVSQLPGRAGARVCGVGSAGPISADRSTVSPLNLHVWQGFPLRERLRSLTGLDVHVDLDAKALALGEGWLGAAQGEENYLAMVVSTGVGAGIVVDGRLLDGASGNAGHLGHVIVEPDGEQCACGSRGCLESQVAGPSITRRFGLDPRDAPPEVVTECGRLVGRAVASAAVLLDLRLAVVAGSVALGFGAPFFEAAQAEVDRAARIAFARGVRIVPAGLGADGPLVGAARVAFLAMPAH